MATKSATWSLEWNGPELTQELTAAIADGLAAWGLIHEQIAKAQLAPGHGYLTGRGQRSIHAAQPDHNWDGDFRAPGRSAPELGGKLVQPAIGSDAITIAVGSGIWYMQIIEGRFSYMARSHEQSVGQLESEIEKKAGSI